MTAAILAAADLDATVIIGAAPQGALSGVRTIADTQPFQADC
jgi:hypothetical protein